MASDEQLIDGYLESGERAALDELVGRYLSKVRGTVYAMVLDRSLADDLTQEVFLRAIRGLGSFDGRARFSTWLYRVAMNTTHSFLARRRRSPLTFHPELPDRPNPAGPCPEGAAIDGELDGAVRAALANLPPKQRAAVVLMTLEDISAAEAARIEGCSTATIYWRSYKARQQLKKCLARHMEP